MKFARLTIPFAVLALAACSNESTLDESPSGTAPESVTESAPAATSDAAPSEAPTLEGPQPTGVDGAEGADGDTQAAPAPAPAPADGAGDAGMGDGGSKGPCEPASFAFLGEDPERIFVPFCDGQWATAALWQTDASMELKWNGVEWEPLKEDGMRNDGQPKACFVKDRLRAEGAPEDFLANLLECKPSYLY